MRWRRGRFGCALCGTELPVVPARRVRTVLVRAPGPSTQRIGALAKQIGVPFSMI